MAKKPTLQQRVQALGEVVELSRGRLDDELIDPAAALVARVDQRLAFAGNHTVIALAGSTGSGKSSTFNALAGAELAEPGVRRPTTSKAMAASWGDAPAELLDWLDVPRRHVVDPATSVGKYSDFAGLVLLDLPDHDSTEVAHRQEVDRLVELVDLLIWVVDPQKYADAALHDSYLKPLAQHAEVTMVVLNQVDRLSPAEAKACLADLRRLLDSRGLGKATVAAISAATGQGIPELRKQLVGVVKSKAAAAARLGADVTRAAAGLAAALTGGQVGSIGSKTRTQLVSSLARAASAEVVVEAVRDATRRRGALATGWPALSWIAALRPDPLRRLRLDLLPGKKGKPALEPARVQRSSLPRTEGAPQARVNSAVRALADEASAGMPRAWVDAVRTASRRHEAELADELDRAISTTNLAMRSGVGWWQAVRVVQWLLIAVLVAGLAWLGVDVALAYFQLPPLPRYRWRSVPYQTWAVIGAVVAGLLLALVSRVGVELTARAKGRRAQQVLHRSVTEVAERLVLRDVNAELDRYTRAKKAIQRAS